jgi:acetoin utilization deacetylase AcuC-like enzyme
MTSPARTAFVADPASLLHFTGYGHPERPDRFNAVLKALSDAGYMDRLSRLSVQLAPDEALLRCHTGEYVELARHQHL